MVQYHIDYRWYNERCLDGRKGFSTLMQPFQSILFKKRWQAILCLALLFTLALGIRAYDLKDLPFDFHPARQFQSMLKARGMFYYGAENVEAWQQKMAVTQWANQPVQEPEIMEHLAAWTYKLIGREDIFYPRLYAALFWLIGGVALYLLLKKLTGVDGAVVGVAFYLFCPYGISASRAFMPDPLMIALLLWSVWAVWRWHEKPGWGGAVLAGVLCALTIYAKLTAVFFLGGAILALALCADGFKKALRNPQYWVMGVIALLPGLLYNLLGIYVLDFIGKSAVINRLIPSMLIEAVSYIRWNNMIVTVTGAAAFLLSLLGIALLDGRAKRSLVLGLWIGYVLFGAFFIYYYTTHDYYHLALIPFTAVGLAALADVLIRRTAELIKPGWFFKLLVFVVLFALVGETMWQVRNDFKRSDYRGEAAFWLTLGDKLRGTNSLAMTDDYNGRLAYYGWYEAAYMPDLNELTHRELAGHSGDIGDTFSALAQGKQFFLVTLLDDLTAEPDFKAWLDSTYPVYDQGDGYIIYDLRGK
jgi:hypothetical protein